MKPSSFDIGLELWYFILIKNYNYLRYKDVNAFNPFCNYLKLFCGGKMNKFKIALASFLLVNSFTFAENLTEFQTKAVKDLYNKGILQTIVKEEDFSKKDNFSRGEIASIIYNTIALKNAESLKGASSEDLTVIKALISDFSSELAKLGAADYELLELIKTEKQIINKRIDDEVVTLNKKIDRINVTGDVTIIKEFDNSKNNPELMKDFSGEGEVALNLNIEENIKGKLSYDLSSEKGEYSLDIKNKDFSLLAFNDESIKTSDWKDWEDKNRSNKKEVLNKKLPDFSNGMGIVSKSGINNIDTIVLKKDMGTKKILSLVTSTETEDIYAVEYKSKMNYFSTTEGSEANMIISYVGLDDKLSTVEDKRFLILGADFIFPINANAKQSLVYNYSKMRQNKTMQGTAGTKYFFPIVSDEATYVNAKTEINSKKYGKTDIVLAGLNTGEYFDASALSDGEKDIFAESDLIKLDKNRFGGIASIKNVKGAFENKFSSVTDKTNNDSEQDITRKVGTLYSLKDGKTKLGFALGQNIEKESTDVSKFDRTFIETELHLTDLLSKNTKDLVKLNIAKEKTTDKSEFTAYVEHREKEEKSELLIATEYKNVANDYKDDDKNSLKAAFTYEKSGKVSEKYDSNFLFGGRYDKNFEENLTEKTEKYAAFTKFNVKVKENINLDGGFRYSQGRTVNSGTTFAAGVTYKFNENYKIGAVYGPVSVLDDYSKNVFENKTDGIYGDADQNIGSIKISGKF